MSQANKPDRVKWLIVAIALAGILISIGVSWGDIMENTRFRLNSEWKISEMHTDIKWIKKELQR